ncbi:hypothetical protein FY034_17240 (plasmid) [Trichlorobacter lovleyi]|uniref:hypothetical protein n=1 Tax=Trichlorobacter lovleyi TaxID=313985 RepID=UPI00223FFA4E|nr:hypothetical protein [Trichlorobacter lovleyi]QOX80768.1 hypothetical protein FY034_17240 [Trichlorobacter lovleyi]
MKTRTTEWAERMLRKISEIASAAINRFSVPRNTISTASAQGHCAFKTAYEAKHGSPEFDFASLTRFRVGHAFEFDIATRLIAGGFVPVEPDEILTHPGPCFCGGGDLLDVCGVTANIRKSLKANGVLLPTEQLTLDIPADDIGANYDIVVKAPNGSFMVWECKTTEDTLTIPRDEWVSQVKTQLGLLRHFAPEGSVIRGAVYCRMGNSIEQDFEIAPPNEKEWADLKARAQHIAQAKRGEVEGAKEPSHFCGFCHAATCQYSPAGRAANSFPLPKDVQQAVENFITTKDIADSYAKEAERHKKKLLDYAGDERMTAKAGKYLVMASPIPGRVTISTKKLATMVSPSILEACSSKGNGYMKVEVKPLPDEPPASNA